MRFALFGTLFAALLVVILALYPLPDYQPLAGPPPAPGFMQCLALEYHPAEPGLPSRVRLVDTVVVAVGPQRVYRAHALNDRYPDRTWATWRPAGADSIDINVLDGPVIRLPLVHGAATGRTIDRHPPSILGAPLTPARTVRAQERPCSSAAEPATRPAPASGGTS